MVGADCPVCSSRPGRTACHGCGRVVCAEDVWTLLGLCRLCVPDISRWHREGKAEERNWLEGP